MWCALNQQQMLPLWLHMKPGRLSGRFFQLYWLSWEYFVKAGVLSVATVVVISLKTSGNVEMLHKNKLEVNKHADRMHNKLVPKSNIIMKPKNIYLQCLYLPASRCCTHSCVTVLFYWMPDWTTNPHTYRLCRNSSKSKRDSTSSEESFVVQQ